MLRTSYIGRRELWASYRRACCPNQIELPGVFAQERRVVPSIPGARLLRTATLFNVGHIKIKELAGHVTHVSVAD